MMQDRFKFRVWSKRECKYVEYYLDDDLTFAIDIDGKLIAYASNYSDYANCDNGDFDDSHIVEQCTGLKDKNVKLIYEGDIVEQEGKFYKVIFSYDNVASCGCCIDKFSGCGFVMEDKYGNRGDLDIYSELEIIGNVYENGNLLENKDE